jgi:superfamily II DNA/RNA helicase
MKFNEFDLDDQLLEAIDYMGFQEATPIQDAAIPLVLAGKDLIACAQTGTGKTAAFVLPILHKLVNRSESSVDTLIIVPTRELAVQIEQQIQGISYFISVGSRAIYGGGDKSDWELDKQALTKGTDIIVATPGKLISHLKLGYVKFNKVKHLVLDEADRMLDMGFQDDLRLIISYLPEDRQTLLFSATMPKDIRELAKRILKDPQEISLSISKTAEGVDQKLVLTHDEQKIPVIADLLKEREHYDSIIIFTSTKNNVGKIVHSLKKAGFPATGISSNLEQEEREEVLRGFRSKRIRILVATDVMSRGIDIKEINMVINFDAPMDAEDYVHRVGRTARANTKGEAVTLVNDKDMQRVGRIERLIDMELLKLMPAEHIGPGPEWRLPERSGKSRFKGKSKKGGPHAPRNHQGQRKNDN